MNIAYKDLIPENFHPQSRVWVYQSSRVFFIGEALAIEEKLEQFIAQWKSHGAPVKGYANIFYGQFIVFMADETQTTVGGCSTDSSVAVIKAIEQEFNVQLLNRQNLAFFIDDKVQVLPLNQLKYGFENGFLKADTVYFNNLVQTKAELLNKWMVPIKESWIAEKLALQATNS
jgi:hypothetical protein